MTTHSYALYSEVGRFPLYIERYVLIAKNVLKLFQIQIGNCVLNYLLQCQYNRVNSNVRHVDWAKQVRDMLQNSGFNDVWCFPESVNETMLKDRHSWFILTYLCFTTKIMLKRLVHYNNLHSIDTYLTN